MLQQQMLQNTFSGLQQGMQEMQQNPAALDVSEEAIAQPHPLVSALDQSRYIC